MENQGVNGCCGEVGEQQAAVASLGAGQGEESIPPCGGTWLVSACRCQECSASCGEGGAGMAEAHRLPALRECVWPTQRVSGQRGFCPLLSHWRWHSECCTDVLVLKFVRWRILRMKAVGVSSK